ncbi:hypothetical protein [Aquipuribacter hungaricus]|uniref:Uncharacterized protein n=1 Tax=Aquipuribacter hungaricus TaxID=545624 RepID=A0ABV7WLW7_9MICO
MIFGYPPGDERATPRPIGGDCGGDVHRITDGKGWGWRGVTYEGGDPTAIIAAYLERGVHQVSLQGGRTEDISWISQLPDLRRALCHTPLKDDTAVWDVDTLTHLVLHDTCKRPARIDQLPNLLSLEMDGRDGLDTAAHHPTLHYLASWRIKTDDLAWLQAGSALREVKLTRRRSQPLTTAGVNLNAVTHLQLGCLTLTDASGLNTGQQLRSVDLDSIDFPSGAAEQTLEVLAGLPRLGLVNVWRCKGLTGADVAAALPQVTVTELY